MIFKPRKCYIIKKQPKNNLYYQNNKKLTCIFFYKIHINFYLF